MSDVDMERWLEIRINNTRPVSLTELTLSLLAFNQQYAKFVDETTNEDQKISTELLIKEVRSGSIVVELVTQVAPFVPLLWSVTPLDTWFTAVTQTLSWLAGKIDKPPQNYTKSDLRGWANFVQPVATDGGSQLNLSVGDNSTVTVNHFSYSSQDAKQALATIQKEADRLDEPSDNVHRRMLMYWYQSRFVDHATAGDKAIIETITLKPVKVIFDNDEVKRQMLAGDERFDRPWQALAYVVDVEVQTVRDVPKLYTILRYYPDDTIDPEE
jgi:hypothetical protein